VTRPALDKTAVSRVLDQIAAHLELRGDNPFRVRAFRAAARTVTSLAGEPASWIADDTLAETRGIGPAIQGVVRDLIASGRSGMLEELREQTPPGLVEMLSISGLGVAKVRQIHERLDVDSISELEAAARDGRLAGLAGFGPRTADNVLRGIARLRQVTTYRLAHHAREEAELIRSALSRVPGVSRAIVAGEVRRGCELVREIVVVLVADASPAEIFRALSQLPGVDEFGGEDERRATLRFAGGESARIMVTPPGNVGAVLVHATGSERHVSLLRARGLERGVRLDGAALWRGNEFVPTPDEAAVYRALGLPPIPPELREGLDEIDVAERGLPRLLEPSDLVGLIHCHTNYSDGNLTVRELALACREAGYRYVGVTDHSGTAAYVGGLSDDEIRRQWGEIDAANAELEGIRVLKGVEADILPDGRLGYSETMLASFDFVIASIHNRFEMGREEMTGRILAAMDNPYVAILGHPTGRLLLSREAYPLDLDRIFARAAETGVAIEINADPQRLDLGWQAVREARRAGVTISIGADAHSASGLSNMAFGVEVARKGWLGPDDVVNTRSVENFLAFAQRRRHGG
jgi:DNA polymerase (family X)